MGRIDPWGSNRHHHRIPDARMSAASARRDDRLTVAVIGVGGALGSAIAQRLGESTGRAAAPAHARGSATGEHLVDDCVAITSVIGVDTVLRPMPNVTAKTADLWSDELASTLAAECVDVVVHAGIEADLSIHDRVQGERATALTANVLKACEEAGVSRLVLVSNAMVYGASPDNPVPLADDGELRADGRLGVVQDLLDAEGQIARWSESASAAVTVLRPAIVVGDAIDTALTRHFEAPRLLVLKDSRPLWQFTHIDDLVTALQCSIVHGIDGPVPVGCSGWLTQDEVEAISGVRRLELPASAVISAADRLHRVGVSPAPAAELDYIRFPWVVGTERLADHGWMPMWTNAQVLEALMVQARGRTTIASRRLGRPDATSLTAVSAAAAVLGAAALVRARRRRLGG